MILAISYLVGLFEAVSKLEGNDVVEHERDTTPKTQKNPSSLWNEKSASQVWA